jgi:hypothetical protein
MLCRGALLRITMLCVCYHYFRLNLHRCALSPLFYTRLTYTTLSGALIPRAHEHKNNIHAPLTQPRTHSHALLSLTRLSLTQHLRKAYPLVSLTRSCTCPRILHLSLLLHHSGDSGLFPSHSPLRYDSGLFPSHSPLRYNIMLVPKKNRLAVYSYLFKGACAPTSPFSSLYRGCTFGSSIFFPCLIIDNYVLITNRN